MGKATIFTEIDQAFAKLNYPSSERVRKVAMTDKELQIFSNDKLKDVRMGVLKKLVDYIDKGDWFKSKSKEEFLNNYKLTTAEYAQRTGRKETSIRQTTARNSKILFTKLGDNIVKDILLSDKQGLEQVNIELSVLLRNEDMLSNFVFDVIKDIVGTDYEKEYTSEELNKEFIILHMCSLAFLESLVSFGDKDKLAYILSSLRGVSSTDFKARCNLFKEIRSKDTRNILINLATRIVNGDRQASYNKILSYMQRKLNESGE